MTGSVIVNTPGTDTHATLELRDLGWIVCRIVQKGVMSCITPRTHLRIAAVRGIVSRYTHGISLDTYRNLNSAFGQELEPKEVYKLASEYAEFSKRLYLSRILPCLGTFNRGGSWRLTGLEHLDEAKRRGKGTILLTAHFGYPHLIPPILEAHGVAVRQVIAAVERQARRNELNERLRKGSKTRQYVYERTRVVTDVPSSEDIVMTLDIRPILRELVNNDIVMIAGDGMWATQYVYLPFLGRRYPFPAGFMKVAIETGASVIPVFAVQKERSEKISVKIFPPLPVDEGMTLEDNVRLFATEFERELRSAPHLWMRWRRKEWFREVLLWSERPLRDRYKMSEGVSCDATLTRSGVDIEQET